MTPITSRNSPRRTLHRLVTLLPPAIFGLAAAVTLSGCPVGAELEDPEGFPIGVGGTGPGTGGTGPATGGTGTGGSGTAGTAGGTGFSFACNNGVDHVVMLNQNCARSACHNNRSVVAGLDLTPDAGLVTRLKDVPAGYGEIDCSNGGAFMECVPTTCPPAGSAKLVDSANPAQSWVLRKSTGAHNECGLPMPVAPGDNPPGGGPFDDARKACLDQLVRAIAAN
jgi:hypothetical protein